MLRQGLRNCTGCGSHPEHQTPAMLLLQPRAPSAVHLHKKPTTANKENRRQPRVKEALLMMMVKLADGRVGYDDLGFWTSLARGKDGKKAGRGNKRVRGSGFTAR